MVIGAALRPLVLPGDHRAPPVLNSTEIGFAQDMTAHHQQAIEMVQRLDPAVDPQVMALARQIERSQEIEIGTMLGWLRLAGAAPTDSHPMMWMHEGGPHHDMAPGPMPGMASAAEMDRLTAARGRDAEILFLQLMYRHHAGGNTMARAADQRIGSGPVKETARSELVDQAQEVGLMTVLLSQRGAEPLP
ncbi:MAG: DUF305 domain-containing protein [Nocardia sp.]|nr:DUF305 domain-containing protein [Nocardia sp.]